ncbi:hypothetical protein [Streptomyces sp. NPDC127033]
MSQEELAHAAGVSP